MDKEKKGYKVVVYNKYAGYVSCSSPLELMYKVGKETKRPAGGGPLAVFNDKKKAQEFMRGMLLHTKLFHCTYTPSENTYGVWFSVVGCRDYVIPLAELPNGTVLADSVTLLEEVTC
jgi:hypothetical protein